MQAPPSLSRRELEILELVASGAKNRQIAVALSLSAYTVKRHIARIMSKLKVASRREAAAFYLHRYQDVRFRPWGWQGCATVSDCTPVDTEPARLLTGREIQVLAEIAKGSSSQQIASDLVISFHTVKRHTANIFGKLGVQNRSHATAFLHAARSAARS